MQELIQSCLNGILLGGLYALIGLGMSLIFGIMKLTNLAHGDLMILGTFSAMVISMQFAGSIILALIITAAIMVVIGFLAQTFLINKVVDKGAEPPLLITFGISIIIQNVLLKFFGADARSIPASLLQKISSIPRCFQFQESIF